MLSYKTPTHKRVEDYGVNNKGEVKFSRTVPAARDKWTKNTSVAEKSRIRRTGLTKSEYRPMVRGYLFRPKMQGKGKSFKFSESERFSTKKNEYDVLDL